MALSGDHVVVKMDDSNGTLRQFADGDIVSVDLGVWYDQHDVTGFGDEVHNVVNGQMNAPVVLRGYLTTTANTGTHTVIEGAFGAGSQVTLEVQVGQNAAPQNGDPMFTGEFLVSTYKPVISTGGAVMFQAQLVPAVGNGSGVPEWTTVS